jgi:PAS domain S-box-containing protein
MAHSRKRLGYFVAVVATLLVLGLRVALNDVLAEQARLMPFTLAVAAAAWFGGLGPGLLATALATVLGVLFIVPPALSLWIETLADAVNAGIFVAIGVTISFLCEALHAAQRHETERQFRTLADSIPQLVWMARADGYRFWFNRRWYEYTGSTLAESEGSGWQRFHDTEQLPRMLDCWRSAVILGEPWEDTYPLRREDGELRWHLARAVPVRNEHGELVCWFGTSTDIQQRIEIEQELKETDERKNQFLATLGHELRNPLAPISNALQLWPYVAHDEGEMRQLRAVVERQLRHLIRLIDDLLDMSRITRGKINLRRQRVDLRDLVTAAAESVKPLIDARGHTLSISLPDEPVCVDGDADRLTQVFANILNNAAKYTGDGGEISVCAEVQDRAVVRVRDNGPGIPRDMLHKIFEPFLQVDSTLDRSHGGLGIGLTLARQLIELHGGTIEARSEGPGAGSEFIVSLSAAPAAVSVHASDGARVRTAQAWALSRQRILVVDDAPDVAETLATLLRAMGQEATALDDGVAAIGWILANRPDVVFLDIAMPCLDGYEIAREVRSHAELQDVVLVALTGYGQEGDRRKALEAGFNFHIAKPAHIDALRDVLRRSSAARMPSVGATA